MHHIILSSVPCLNLPCFSTPHKRHYFGAGGVTEHNVCCYVLYNSGLKHLSFKELSEIISSMYIVLRFATLCVWFFFI